MVQLCEAQLVDVNVLETSEPQKLISNPQEAHFNPPIWTSLSRVAVKVMSYDVR